MNNKPLAFMSYTRFDDEFEQGALTQFREALSRTIRFLSGDTIEIFQDVADIGLGQRIQQRIRESLNESMVLIPIITPNYFKSAWCREELSLFLEREHRLGRNDLVISVYYQRVPEFDDAMQHPSKAQASTDTLIQEIAQRLAVNWQPFRGKDFSDPHVRQELERIAQRIVDILAELQSTKSLTSGQRRRLQQKLDGLQQEWGLRSEKLNRLRHALSIETDPSTKFKLEQQISDEETAQDGLAKEMEEIERALG